MESTLVDIATYFKEIPALLATLQAQVNEDILCPGVKEDCAQQVALLMDLETMVKPFFVHSNFSIEVARLLLIGFHDVYCRVRSLVLQVRSYDTLIAQEVRRNEWKRYHISQIRMSYDVAKDDISFLMKDLEADLRERLVARLRCQAYFAQTHR